MLRRLPGSAVMAELRRRGLIEGKGRARSSGSRPRGRGAASAKRDIARQEPPDRDRRLDLARNRAGELHRRDLSRRPADPRPDPGDDPAAPVAAAQGGRLPPAGNGRRWSSTPIDGLVGVHCTYLAPDGSGKAAGSSRTSASSARSAAAPSGWRPRPDTLAVSEGIETGLSYMEATGTPTWAALSAGRHPHADPARRGAARRHRRRSRSGRDHGRTRCRPQMARRRPAVSIARPPLGLDFNDMARVVLG